MDHIKLTAILWLTRHLQTALLWLQSKRYDIVDRALKEQEKL